MVDLKAINEMDVRISAPVHKHEYINRVTTKLLPKFINGMRKRSADYPPDSHLVLGARGEYTHIWRKTQKLKKAIWDNEPMVGEQAEEILYDLIGHCFLTIDALQQEGQGVKATQDELDEHQAEKYGDPAQPYIDREKDDKDLLAFRDRRGVTIKASAPDISPQLRTILERVVQGRLITPEQRAILKFFTKSTD